MIGKVVFVFGLALAVIGILVPLFAAFHVLEVSYLGPPFLFGIVMVILGIILMVVSWILFRSVD